MLAFLAVHFIIFIKNICDGMNKDSAEIIRLEHTNKINSFLIVNNS